MTEQEKIRMAKREYMRKYMKKRRQEPEFKERERQYQDKYWLRKAEELEQQFNQ